MAIDQETVNKIAVELRTTGATKGTPFILCMKAALACGGNKEVAEKELRKLIIQQGAKILTEKKNDTTEFGSLFFYNTGKKVGYSIVNVASGFSTEIDFYKDLGNSLAKSMTVCDEEKAKEENLEKLNYLAGYLKENIRILELGCYEVEHNAIVAADMHSGDCIGEIVIADVNVGSENPSLQEKIEFYISNLSKQEIANPQQIFTRDEIKGSPEKITTFHELKSQKVQIYNIIVKKL